MRDYKPMTTGWGRLAQIHYGAGLMINRAALSLDKTTNWDYAYFEGHGGETYGFSSTQGFSSKAQAAFSIVTNTDNGTYSAVAACRMMVALAETRGDQVDYGCGKVVINPFETFLV
mmetsp:Transcript_23674/g.53963  ORF Transcript_23674/g.53963 Transcript_23674/m.53963 type:complete len:116 (+) Transcript_23674:2-349(+)